VVEEVAPLVVVVEEVAPRPSRNHRRDHRWSMRSLCSPAVVEEVALLAGGGWGGRSASWWLRRSRCFLVVEEVALLRGGWGGRSATVSKPPLRSAATPRAAGRGGRSATVRRAPLRWSVSPCGSADDKFCVGPLTDW